MKKGHTYYYCDNCGAIIEDENLKVCRIKEGEFWRTVACCPDCKNDALEEMEHCKMCGELIRECEEYCEDCKTAVYKIWEKAVSEVMDRCDCDYTECESRFIEFLSDTGVL